MLRKTIIVATAIFLFSCAGEPPKESAETSANEMVSEATYTPEMVVNTKDYTCGMPVTAGISDTCHYEGKAYGFCSKGCMEEFKKDPAKVLAQQN